MPHTCDTCGNSYVWSQDLKRHAKIRHASKQQQQQQQQQEFVIENGSDLIKQQQQQQQQQEFVIENGSDSIKQQQQQQQDFVSENRYDKMEQQQQQQQHFVFQHPFTCIVSGPTSCGKTYFVAELLRRAQSRIQPVPQRIIWVYKRWQPLYDFIRKTVIPRVEFIKGIPITLEKDDFIDPRLRNVIVLDDIAVEASKDQRVTDLFTEGSHHRNLSVIALNQNLYLSKDPTQRRNCNYLVLFNNPVDKQPIATLARQMYPNNPKELIRYFEDAIARPYVYLLLDLKPFTKESMRMRTDVFNTINTDKSASSPHLAEGTRTERTFPEDKLPGTHQNMASAVHKGITPIKRQRLLEDTDDIFGSDESSDMVDNRENEVYELFFGLAKQRYEKTWQKKVDKYNKEGLDEKRAQEKANVKMRPIELEDFMQRYGTYISQMLKLRGGLLHEEIMASVDRYIDRGIDQERAIRLSLRKHSHQFEEYLDVDDDNNSDDSDDMDVEVSEDDSEEEESDTE